MWYCCGVEFYVFYNMAEFTVWNKVKNRAKWTISGTVDDEISQKA